MTKPQIVIIGAGFGGLAAAIDLRGVDADVTVIDKRNHHLFQPLLYQVATAGLSPADIAVPVRSVLRGHPNARVLMDEVTAVDLTGRQVITATRRVPYDYLIVAPGAGASYFGHDTWAGHAPGLKSIDDATAIRSRILAAFEQAEMAASETDRARLMTFVLVGAGPTGVEMAGAIAELAKRALARDFRAIDPNATRVVLVEGGPAVLPGFPGGLAAYTKRSLERMGVEVRCDTSVTEVTADGVTVGETDIPAATVIWCAGVRAVDVGGWLGVETERQGRVAVGADLSLPSQPNVFVIGDAAHAEMPDGKPFPGLASVAKQQGQFVARLLRARLGGDTGSLSFRYRDLGTLATIGRSSAVAVFGRVMLRGWLAWVVWSLAHIYLLISFRNRLLVFVQWVWAYLTFGRGARLITGPTQKQRTG